MALNAARIADFAFDYLVGAESLKMAAYSGFTLLVLCNNRAPAGKRVDHKTLRKMLSVRADQTGVIAKNTWESYAKGIDDAADKLAENLATDPEFLAIFDTDEESAIDGVRLIFEGLNVVSGGDIREWSKAPGFEPLDKEAAKAARKAKAAADKLAKAQTEAALFFATNYGDASDVAPALPATLSADPVAAIVAALATLTAAQRQDILTALNPMLATDATNGAAALAAAPAATVAPVLADDVTPHPLSALGRVTRKRQAA